MEKLMTFVGFPEGKNPTVPVPEVFFTHVLPSIEDGAELKVTMHLFWLLAKKRGQPRCISDRELLNDRVLLRSLRRAGDPRSPEDRLRQGLALGVARGTLLGVFLTFVGADGPAPIAWYFFNTPRNQKVVAEIEGGQMVPAHLLLNKNSTEQQALHELATIPEGSELFQGDEQEAVEPFQEQKQREEIPVAAGVYAKPVGHEKNHPLHVEVERPNIFVLYEQNIGLLTPLIAEDLKDAADQYPMEWIEAAFREAVHQNKRNWRYISAILRRWETEGRQQWNA
jgi:DNA replication protein